MELLPLNDYDRALIGKLIGNALREDIGAGDVTSNAILAGDENGAARTIAKSELVIAGGDVFRETFRQVDPTLTLTILATEGQEVETGTLLAEISGSLNPSSWQSGRP